MFRLRIDSEPSLAARPAPVTPMPLAGAQPAATALTPSTVLLSTDFETGQALAWLSAGGQTNPRVVTLPDGNRALQIQEGVEALYSPSWDWNIADYRLEADVMVADLNSGTSIGWNARILNNTLVGFCQGYRAEIGPDYDAVHVITAPQRNCNSSWQYETLNNDTFTLKANEWHHLQLDVKGNHLRFYIDGRLALTATDTENRYPSGGVGLIVFESDEAFIDNLVITTLPAAP